MTRFNAFLLALFAFCCYSCSQYTVLSSWKAPGIAPRTFSKILVVGIVHDTDFALRQNMEDHFVGDLQDLGYNAVSALEAFGPKGLASLAQEQTYLKLCDKGIDGVITIALIDKRKEQTYVPARVRYYSNLYYYNRIWNYQKIQADLVSQRQDSIVNTAFRWESIFFDVNTLEPLYTIQTKSFDPASVQNQAHQYGKTIVASMVKNKVLRKQERPVTDSLKAF